MGENSALSIKPKKSKKIKEWQIRN